VHLTSYFMALVVKSVFGRLRPTQLLDSQARDASWFVGGGSFPSGHVAYYVSLFLPLMVVFPRWRWPLLFVPTFIVISRVNENDHFLSDTTGSIALVALITVGLMAVMERWLPRRPSQTSNESDKIR
jgi:membrane-associated phospholipid phosphatase